MKPTFALNITDKAVGLLHRTSKGWTPVGEVPFSEPDLAEALGYLRKTALGLSPRGISTKLVIPNSQILYAQLEAPGPDEASRLAQIRTGLEGRTPYDVADLVFDWHATGATVQVAVVARETLTEAEAFASEHRLNPMSFVAIPEGDFVGEPFFGPTAHAQSQLASGEVVERDKSPIVIRTRDLPKAEADVPVMPPPETAAADFSAPETTPEATPTDALVATPAPDAIEATPEADPEPKVIADQIYTVPDDPEPLIAFQDTRPLPEPKPVVSYWSDKTPDPLPEPVYAPLAEPAAQPPAAPFAAQAPAAPFAAPVPLEAETLPDLTLPPPAVVDPDEAPFTHVVDATPFPEIDDAPAMPPGLDKTKRDENLDDLPPAPSAAIRMAFASRRDAATLPAASLPPIVATPVAAGPSGLNGNANGVGATIAGRLSGFAKPAESAPQSATMRAARGKPIEELPPMPRPAQAGAKPAASGGVAGSARSSMSKGFGAFVAPPGATSKKKKPTSATAAVMIDPRQPAQTLAANKPLTKPGGTFGARPVQRGKPKYLGLILTGILLLFLALVAAWSSLYLASGDTAVDTTTETAALATPSADAGVPGVDQEMLADQQDPADLAVDDAAAEDLAADPVAQAAVEEPAPEVPADPAPLTADVATAPSASADSPTAAPLTEGQDEIFLAAMDSPPPALDALALPAPETAGDAAPDAQAPPPPFGTVYQFDANGLIQPTPEGILTPEGVMLFAGKPPVVPPRRSAAVEAAAAAAVQPILPAPTTALPTAGAITGATVEAVPVGEAAPVADPALKEFRPKARPQGLTPAVQNGAITATDGETAVTSLRPRTRPQTVLAAGTAARQETEAASLAAQAEEIAKAQAAALAAADPADPSLLAISRRPAERPRDLSRAVEAAVAAAIRAPDPEPAAEPEPEVQLAAAAPAPRVRAKVKEPEVASEPEADSEPEIAPAARSTSLKGTVAKKATYVKAINLSKINLIGVYGSDSKRYALVRQSNGRYKKVRVGDNVDGGKVAAITASEVRYQKGGRIVTLKLPKS